ncbi:MAG: efflux RND transporter periplasmic adaptor subunit [Bryobacteraceae bacterium]|nr:efflux RND transporter periplasmic adaptor subunit [Bryobacteraceae bacterium]
MTPNGKNGKNRKWRKRLIWLGILVVVIGCAGYGVHAALKPDNKIDPSKLATVERGSIARSVVATGKVEPRSTVEVKSKASGIVKKLYVDYSDYVHQGQVLAELDKENLEATVRESKANLQAAQAAEESAQASLERNKVDAEGPDLPFLKTAMDRARELNKQGLIAKNSVEDAEKAYQMALNKQSSALRNLAVSRAEITKAKAVVAQSTAALERAEQDLRNSTIVSPIDGLVLSRDVEVGNAVSSILVLGSEATLLFTLGDISDVFVRGKVDQADIGKVYLTQPTRITVESFRDKKFNGKVYQISPLGVEKENVTTFEVKVSIANPGHELKALMSANAEIILEEKPNVLLVPEAAIIYDKDRKATVEVPDVTAEKGRKKVPVKLGISNGVKTELVAGLNQGAKVILQ